METMIEVGVDLPNVANKYAPPVLRPDLLAKELAFEEPEKLDPQKFEFRSDLGEGTFGNVKLFCHKEKPNEYIAVKIIDLKKSKGEVLKVMMQKCCAELIILKLLRKHENVVQFLGKFANTNQDLKIFMEYVDGGELFDQIEPDVGMNVDFARHLFRQLIEGLDYIHEKGVVHRDLKPENILLTSSDVLKISDFGLATLYKTLGTEVKLSQPCGTPQYAAPEVVSGSYRGPPVDVWSAGVTLMVALLGVMPWERASDESDTYKAFVHNKDYTSEPFNRLDTEALALFNIIMVEDVQKRADLERLKKHPWLNESADRRSPLPLKPVHCDFPATQPDSARTSMLDQSHSQFQDKFQNNENVANYFFSQPLGCDSTMLNQSQVIGASQGTVYHPIHSFVRRMTRFCTRTPVDDLINYVEEACMSLNFSTSLIGPQQIMVKCHRRTVHFIIQIFTMNEGPNLKNLVDARRSRGLGIDFKRCYADFRKAIQRNVATESDSWLRELGLIPGAFQKYPQSPF